MLCVCAVRCGAVCAHTIVNVGGVSSLFVRGGEVIESNGGRVIFSRMLRGTKPSSPFDFETNIQSGST